MSGFTNQAGRRQFMTTGSAVGITLLLPWAAPVQAKITIRGEATLNGRQLTPNATVRPGDRIRTGADSRVSFVIGQDAILLRADSELTLQGAAAAATANVFRLITGAMLAAFGRGERREIATATATAGIRGTAVYVEAHAEHTYLCNCYGVVELSDPQKTVRRLLASGNHNANRISTGEQGGTIESAPMMNHTNQELVMLEALVGRKPAFSKAS